MHTKSWTSESSDVSFPFQQQMNTQLHLHSSTPLHSRRNFNVSVSRRKVKRKASQNGDVNTSRGMLTRSAEQAPCKHTVKSDKHQSCWPFLYYRRVSYEHLKLAHTPGHRSNDWRCDVMSYNYMPRQLREPVVLTQLARDLTELWTVCYLLHTGRKERASADRNCQLYNLQEYRVWKRQVTKLFQRLRKHK